MSSLEFSTESVCAVHGQAETVFQGLVFVDINEVDRVICADCVASLAEALDLSGHALDRYTEAWASRVLGISVTVADSETRQG